MSKIQNIILFALFILTSAFSSFAQQALPDSYNITKNIATVFDVRNNDGYDIDDYITIPYQSYSGLNLVPPQHGTIIFLNNYTIMYMPDSNFVGHDEFVYGIAYYDKYYYAIDTARVSVNVFNPIATTCQASFMYLKNTGFNDFTFQDESTENVIFWHWDFGDGNTSSAQNPNYSFPDSGTYHVCLTVITNLGCMKTFCSDVYAPDFYELPNLCTANFSFVHVENSGNINEFLFSDLSSGDVVSWLWNFGDGNSSILKNPNHIFLNTGNYNVCLDITTSDGCFKQFCSQIIVSDQVSCSADFSYVSSNDMVVVFNDLSLGSIVNRSWNFGDISLSTLTNPQHIFNSTGHYQVCLTITTTQGCTNTVCKDVQVTHHLASNVQFNGVVWAGTNLLPDGVAVLFDSVNHYKAIAWSKIHNGVWSFDEAPGKYLVYAIPLYNYQLALNKMYFPTYTGNSLQWQNAQIINTANLPPNIDIHLLSTDNLSQYYGNSGLNGNIYYTSDLTYESDIFDNLWFEDDTANVILKSNKARNMPVILFNEQNVPIKFMLSKNSGVFDFAKLKYGNYTIYTEKAGMQTIPLSVQLDSQQKDLFDISIYIGSVYITSGIEDINVNQNTNNLKMYPVPVTDVLNINVESFEKEKLTVEISDATGKLILANNYDILLTKNTISINTQKLKSGLYLVRFITEKGKIFTAKIVK